MILFCLFCTLVFGLSYVVKRKRVLGRIRRTVKHEVYLAFLMDLLNEPEIVRATVSHGCVTMETIEALRENAGTLSYPSVRAMTAKVMDSRVVRRLVTRHLCRVHGVSRSQVARNLSAFMREIKE